MKKEDIYLWTLAVIMVVAVWFALTNMPESMLDAIKNSGL